MERFIKRIDEQILAIIQAEAVFANDFARLQTIPGVGALTAARVLAVARKLLLFMRALLVADQDYRAPALNATQ